MDKKGFELAISTLVLFILGILVLIGLIYFIEGGLGKFSASSNNLLDSAQVQTIKQACDIACKGGDKITYCCKNYTASGYNVQCSDSRLEVKCQFLSCQNIIC